jgi:hypothetical protein
VDGYQGLAADLDGDADAPALRGFQMGADAGQANVNLFRGTVTMTLPLVSLGGPPGLDLKLSALYEADQAASVDKWNLEAPTGILGSGWTLDLDYIAADSIVAPASRRSYYLVSGGVTSRLVFAGYADESTLSFQLEDFQFWEVRYHASADCWTVVDESGTRKTFGEDGASGEAAQPVQLGVKWGGAEGTWTGGSSQTAGQATVTAAWNLRRVETLWGDAIEYAYTRDDVPVGDPSGMPFTRACYLRQVTDAYGRAVSFDYEEKDPRELQLLHAAPDDGSVQFQDRYERSYLAAIEVRNPASAPDDLLQRLTFGYDLRNDSTEPGQDDFVKRYLTSVSTETPEASTQLPPLQLDYYEAADKSPATGQLASMEYANGGVTHWTYASQPLPGATRVLGGITGSGKPRVWFGSGYTVITWYDDGAATLSVSIYQWNGSWQSSTDTISTALQLGTLDVSCEDDFFLLTFVSKAGELMAYTFTPRAGSFGQWDSTVEILTLASPSTKASAGTGASYYLVVTDDGQSLCQAYDPVARLWLPQSVQLPSGDKHVVACAADYFAVAVYSESAGTCTLAMSAWSARSGQFTDVSLPQPMLSPIFWVDAYDVTLLAPAENQLTVTYLQDETVSYKSLTFGWDTSWDVSVARSSQESVDPNTVEPFYLSVPAGALLGNAQHLSRFDGVSWVTDDLPADEDGNTPRYAYGSDIAIRATASTVAGAHYDAHQGAFEQLSVDPAGAGSSTDPYTPTVRGIYATAGRAIYCRQSSGDLVVIQMLLDQDLEPDAILNFAPDYIATQTTDGLVRVYLLANGAVADVVSPDGRIFVTDPDLRDKPGTLLAGRVRVLPGGQPRLGDRAHALPGPRRVDRPGALRRPRGAHGPRRRHPHSADRVLVHRLGRDDLAGLELRPVLAGPQRRRHLRPEHDALWVLAAHLLERPGHGRRADPVRLPERIPRPGRDVRRRWPTAHRAVDQLRGLRVLPGPGRSHARDPVEGRLDATRRGRGHVVRTGDRAGHSLGRGARHAGEAREHDEALVRPLDGPHRLEGLDGRQLGRAAGRGRDQDSLRPRDGISGAARTARAHAPGRGRPDGQRCRHRPQGLDVAELGRRGPSPLGTGPLLPGAPAGTPVRRLGQRRAALADRLADDSRGDAADRPRCGPRGDRRLRDHGQHALRRARDHTARQRPQRVPGRVHVPGVRGRRGPAGLDVRREAAVRRLRADGRRQHRAVLLRPPAGPVRRAAADVRDRDRERGGDVPRLVLDQGRERRGRPGRRAGSGERRSLPVRRD